MIQIVYLVIIFAIQSTHQKALQCQFSWTQFNGSCYGFLLQRMSWIDGMMTCYIYGGHLPEIETKAENTWLVKQFKKRGYEAVWLGGSDQFHEGVWYWVVSKKKVGPYLNWKKPQPDNHKGGEHCMEVRRNRSYKWNDNVCVTLQHVVCEKNP